VKRLSVVLAIVFLTGGPVWAEIVQSAALDKWRIEAGPPGNEFSDSHAVTKGKGDGSEKGAKGKAGETEIPEAAERWAKVLAPEAVISSTGSYGSELRYIVFEDQRQLYWLLVSLQGEMVWLQSTDKLDQIEEAVNAIVPKGRRMEIGVGRLPGRMVETLDQLLPGSAPEQAWFADTLVGPRYIARVGAVVFYATPGGRIRSGAAVAAGGLAEVASDATLGPMLPESLQKILGPYRGRFNVRNQIDQLRKDAEKAGNYEEGFRFIAMGDSRSQKDLWEAIVAHIDQLEPAPLFVINAGDVVLNGTAAEFVDYYIPPLLKTDIPYFIAVGNHDIGKSGEKGTYEYLFGEGSLNYTFDVGRNRFIFLDNVSGKTPWERVLVRADQWLTDAPEGYRKIVSVHMPPATIEKWAYHAMGPAGSKMFTDLMAKHGVDQVFLGHIHAYSTATLDGVPYTIAGGGGAELHRNFGPLGSVHHYVICDVTPEGIRQQVVRFYRKEGDTAEAQSGKGKASGSKKKGY